MEKRHHGFVAQDLQCVGFAGALVDECSRPGDPVGLFVFPRTLQAIARDGTGVIMAVDAGTGRTAENDRKAIAYSGRT